MKAKSQEPGNLVPGHFWCKIRTYFTNQRFKEINLKLCHGFVKNRFKWMPVSLHFYLKHHNIYPHNPLFNKFVQINCPDISESKSRFPDKNNLFACLDESWVIYQFKGDIHRAVSSTKNPDFFSVGVLLSICLFSLFFFFVSPLL